MSAYVASLIGQKRPLNDDTTMIDTLPNEIRKKIKLPGLIHLLENLLKGMRIIGATLRDGAYSSSAVGTTNKFGDDQLEVDVKIDNMLFDLLKSTGNVHIAASEENPVEINCNYNNNLSLNNNENENGYSVAFDPLDGSSIIDANFAVGTILGIWPGNGLLNRIGDEQVASLITMYGPLVTLALAINSNASIDGQRHCIELTMSPNSWNLSKSLTISNQAETFAPGNLRATSDNSNYMDLVQYWIENKYTLRYSGGLVPDVYHILIKGQGVLSNASSKKAKAKLRLLFECAPIALIIEAAGGDSCACPTEIGESMDAKSILKVRINSIDQRLGVCYGSKDEVKRFRNYIFGEKNTI